MAVKETHKDEQYSWSKPLTLEQTSKRPTPWDGNGVPMQSFIFGFHGHPYAASDLATNMSISNFSVTSSLVSQTASNNADKEIIITAANTWTIFRYPLAGPKVYNANL